MPLLLLVILFLSCKKDNKVCYECERSIQKYTDNKPTVSNSYQEELCGVTQEQIDKYVAAGNNETISDSSNHKIKIITKAECKLKP